MTRLLGLGHRGVLMSKEDWLYEITLTQVNKLHSISLISVIDSKKKIPLSTPSEAGSKRFQIDVFAFDLTNKILLFAECKDFLSIQAASASSEELSMKPYILKRYPPREALGKYDFDFKNIDNFKLIQYISLGSHSGNCYQNAKNFDDKELLNRLNFFKNYLKAINRDYMGILLFPETGKQPLHEMATPRLWSEI